MRRVRSSLAAAVACLPFVLFPVPLVAQRTTSVALDMQLVDEDGNAVAGVEVADAWRFADGQWRSGMICSKEGPFRSDDEGRVRGTWTLAPLGEALLALSADRRLVALIRHQSEEEGHGLCVRGRVTMVRPVAMTGRVRTVLEPRPIVVGLSAPGAGSIGMFPSDTAEFSLPLPPGTYSASFRTGHGFAPSRTVVLESGSDEFDFGFVTVNVRPFDLIGEVLPDWDVRACRNIPSDEATLSRMRGKPLLIVFDQWGRRLATGIREDVAGLREHPRLEDFEVILFDSSWGPLVQGAPEPVVEDFFPLIRGRRSGRDLYGSDWAVVVLDPNGRLVHCGRSVGDAVAALERLLD